MKLSIVIPVLNESQSIPLMLDHWRILDDSTEVLFVDGGSIDGTCELLTKAGFAVIASPKGRARQMNAGIVGTFGDVLLFLHADTVLPGDALTLITRGLAAEERVWGRFDVTVEGNSLLFPIISFMINLRSRFSGIATGDQAIFVRRDALQKVGCFPDQPLMEDVEVSKRLGQLSRPLCLRQRVRTSGRRWETRGVWSTVFLMWRLRFAYWKGVPATELAKHYR